MLGVSCKSLFLSGVFDFILEGSTAQEFNLGEWLFRLGRHSGGGKIKRVKLIGLIIQYQGGKHGNHCPSQTRNT